MAYYNKIGLLILNDDSTKFLVCQKYRENVTAEYIMPGGKNDEQDDMLCLKNEIDQELGCQVDFYSVELVGIYSDTAAGFSDRDVEIKLYKGRLIGQPTPMTEVEYIHWIGKGDIENKQVSSIIRTKILPDIIERKILN